MEPLRTPTLIAAAVTMGLMAGFFYTYTISIMPALRRTDDRTFVATMQSINIAILNGWFFLIFIGTFLFTAAATVLHLIGGTPARFWILAALVLYTASLVITGRANIPLNNALEAAGDPDRAADLAAVRKRFEQPWVRWNLARTVLSIAGFGCLIGALLQRA